MERGTHFQFESTLIVVDTPFCTFATNMCFDKEKLNVTFIFNRHFLPIGCSFVPVP